MYRQRTRLWVRSLENRTLPAAVVPPAFDAAGHALPGNHSRIGDSLLRLFNDAATGRAANPRMVYDTDGAVLIRVTGCDISALQSPLAAVGFRTTGSLPDLNLIEGFLPLASLPQIENMANLGLYGAFAIPRPTNDVGLVTSEADWVLEADRERLDFSSFGGYNGSGIRIGVMSNSYATRVAPITTAAQDIANNDLPAAGVVVQQEGPAGASDEGRGMMQLIHDLAPSASLRFASASFGEANYATQIKNLADPAIGNCNLLVDDVPYQTEPLYQHGVIAQAVDFVVTTYDKPYFASAGNRGGQGYEAIGPGFAADALGTSLDFLAGAGIDTRQRLTLSTAAGSNSLSIALQWDDPWYTVAGVDTDLDLYLVRVDTGAVVASSTDNAIALQTPIEILDYTNSTGQTLFDLVIRRFAGPNPGRVKYVEWGNSNMSEYGPNGSTVNGHSAIANAAGVGAIPWYNQTTPESFTSDGGNVTLFSPTGVLLGAPVNEPGPRFAALDGTNTTFFGGDDGDSDTNPNFYGTSAAAPHAAAVGALLLQQDPTRGAFTIYNLLAAYADDSVGAPGDDPQTGAGLINAYDTIIGSARAKETNLFDGFESSVLDWRWETHTTGAGHIEVTTANSPATGTYHVTMDADFPGSNSLNELILHVNLANVHNAVLTFDQKEFSDEDHPMSATFVGSENSDGVAMSVDGTNWYRLVSLTGASSSSVYQTFTYNLNKVAADNGLTLDSNVSIKFQQYDNSAISGDGMAFDNIDVTRYGTISGISYNDTNLSGSFTAGEPLRVGSVIYVDANNNDRFDYGNTIVFTSPQLPVAVRDLTTTRIPLTVSGYAGTVSDVDVHLDISHTWDSDLDIALIGPDGTRVTLSTDNGSSGDNYTKTTFDDEAATLITTGAAPFTGRYRPEISLSLLDGVPLAGTWYLEVADDTGGDVGVVNSWSLTLSRDFASTDTPIATIDNGTIESKRVVSGLAGIVSDVNVTLNITHPFDAALDLYLIGPNGTIVELSTDNGSTGDNYTNTIFDDEAATLITAGTAPFTGRFIPEGSLATLAGLSPNGTWTLRVTDDDGFGDVGSLVSWTLEIGRTFSQDDAPYVIPDPGTVTKTLPVINLTGPIQDVTVNLDLTHTWNDDLDVYLTSPTGTKIFLFNDVGGSSDNFTATTLDDAAKVPITAGIGPFTGTFRPVNALSAFAGEDANGDWTLTVTDDTGSDSGTVVDWSIGISTAATAKNSTAINILDRDTVYSTVVMTGVTGNINDVNVTMDLTHTFDGDLDIYLISPSGVRIALTTDNGGAGDNYTNTTFDDEASTSITSGVAPFSGTFRPEGQLSLLDGTSPNGVWYLEITDDTATDTGMLKSWSVTLTTGELFTVSGTGGAYTLPNLGAGTHKVRESLSAGRYHTEPVPDEYSITLDNNAAVTVASKNFGSVADVVAPTASITAVSPDPRNSTVSSIQIVFSEPVTGVTVSDFELTVNGGANLLTGAQLISSLDGGITWTLANLAGITAAAGNYVLQLTGVGSDIVDRAHNAYTSFDVETWTMDLTAPTILSIVRADPNPTAAPEVYWTVTFDEAVTGLNVANFALINGGLGGAVSISGILGVGTIWTVKASTGTGVGTLGLDLVNAAGITDLAGNPVIGVPSIGQVYNIAHTPPKVLPIIINGGATQRSRVTSVEVDFDQLVTLPALPETAFQLKRQSDGALVTLAAAVVNTTTTKVTLTFTGGAAEFKSLADGRYTLTAFAASVSGPAGQLDGNGDGVGNDNFVLASAALPNPPTNIFRLFGDENGDGTVAANDFIQFRLALGGSSPIFDYDDDGAVAASDFIQFRLRFGGSI